MLVNSNWSMFLPRVTKNKKAQSKSVPIYMLINNTLEETKNDNRFPDGCQI